jgi:hypothetical protein
LRTRALLNVARPLSPVHLIAKTRLTLLTALVALGACPLTLLPCLRASAITFRHYPKPSHTLRQVA